MKTLADAVETGLHALLIPIYKHEIQVLAGLTKRRTIKGVYLPAISRYFDGEGYMKYKMQFFLSNGLPLSGYKIILSMTHSVLTQNCRPGEPVNYHND